MLTQKSVRFQMFQRRYNRKKLIIYGLTLANLSVPKSRMGSKVFSLKISGCKRLIGAPLTLIKPLPFLTKATAVAVF